MKAAQAIQNTNGAAAYSQEIVKMREENAKLKTDVETWKSKLTAAEVASGKKVFCAPVKSEEKPKEEKEEAAQAPATEKKEKKVKPDKPGKAPKEKK